MKHVFWLRNKLFINRRQVVAWIFIHTLFLVIFPVIIQQDFNDCVFKSFRPNSFVHRQNLDQLFNRRVVSIYGVSVGMLFHVSNLDVVLVGCSPPWFRQFMVLVEFFHDYWNLKSNRHFSFNIVFRFSWSCLIIFSVSCFIFSSPTVFEYRWKISTSLIQSIFNPWSTALWNIKSSQYRSFNLSSIFQIFFRFDFFIAHACHEILLSLYLNHSSYGVL